MRSLRFYLDYVLAKPYVPGGGGVTFAQKYGPVAHPCTKFDLPTHTAARPQWTRYALSDELTEELLEFVRTVYCDAHPVLHLAARDYTAQVLMFAVWGRISEVVTIQVGDVDDETERVRLFGKAKRYSGKRARIVDMGERAADTLRIFCKVYRPMFPGAENAEQVFLNEEGASLGRVALWRVFRKIVAMAVEHGIPIPEGLRPHDARGTGATNDIRRNPKAYRKTLKKLGHTSPASAGPYMIATDDVVEETEADLQDVFIDPHVERRDGR